MKMVCRAALLMAALMGCSLPALAQDDVLGRWATPGVAAVVELARCPDAATLCGTVRWLWDAVDEKGRSRLDTQNPESSLRSRPLVGVSILSGLAPASAGWSGRIYNPEDGQTYRATLRLTGGDTLLVEGCVLFVCQKQTWRRASTVAAALARSSP